jgi:hypothetical protein
MVENCGMPDLKVKLTKDKDGNPVVNFDHDALFRAPLSQLMGAPQIVVAPNVQGAGSKKAKKR